MQVINLIISAIETTVEDKYKTSFSFLICILEYRRTRTNAVVCSINIHKDTHFKELFLGILRSKNLNFLYICLIYINFKDT